MAVISLASMAVVTIGFVVTNEDLFKTESRSINGQLSMCNLVYFK